ncbi:MAG: peptidyl-prolyl cis-trans isomerase [Pseudomonadota bacterium]
MTAVKRVLREPIIHFMLIGAFVTALYAAFAGNTPGGGTIVISQSEQAEFANRFQRAWGRPPTEAERANMIEAALREEVLYREARSLGLGENDTVVRHRLAQKMALLMEPTPPPPTEADLTAFLRENIARYRDLPRVAFTQIFLSPATRGDTIEADAADLLKDLRNGANPAPLSDATQLPETVSLTTLPNVRRVFGPELTAALRTIPLETWSGPLKSAYGLHLIKLTARQTPPDPTLSDVRDAVRRDWEATRRNALARAGYAALRDRYDVVIEPADPSARP